MLIISRERLYSFPKISNCLFCLSHRKVHLFSKLLHFFINYTHHTKFILFCRFGVTHSDGVTRRGPQPPPKTSRRHCLHVHVRHWKSILHCKFNWVFLVVRSHGCLSRLLLKLQTWNTWVPSWLGWWRWLQEFSFRFRSSEVNDPLKTIMFNQTILLVLWRRCSSLWFVLD